MLELNRVSTSKYSKKTVPSSLLSLHMQCGHFYFTQLLTAFTCVVTTTSSYKSVWSHQFNHFYSPEWISARSDISSTDSTALFCLSKYFPSKSQFLPVMRWTSAKQFLLAIVRSVDPDFSLGLFFFFFCLFLFLQSMGGKVTATKTWAHPESSLVTATLRAKTGSLSLSILAHTASKIKCNKSMSGFGLFKQEKSL